MENNPSSRLVFLFSWGKARSLKTSFHPSKSIILRAATLTCILVLVFSSRGLPVNLSDGGQAFDLASAQSQAPTVAITQPANNSIVANVITTQGTFQNVPSGSLVWLVIDNYVKALPEHKFFPMEEPVNISGSSSWYYNETTLGGQYDTGSRFEIIAVLADQNAQVKIAGYNNASRANNYTYSGVNASDWQSYGTIEITRVTTWLDSSLNPQTIQQPLTASASPSSQEVKVNVNATLLVRASGGSPPYSYQWHEGLSEMPGEKGSILTVNKTVAGSYQFYCRVNCSIGPSIDTDAVNVIVNPLIPPAITITQPLNNSIVANIITAQGTCQNIPDEATFWLVVFVPKLDPPRYYPMNSFVAVRPNWYYKDTTIGGNDTGSEFDIITVLADQEAQTKIMSYINFSITANKGNFSGIVDTDWQNYGTTEVCRVITWLNSSLPPYTILQPLNASASPTSREILVGENATFSVNATGGSKPYSYQWYEGSFALQGENENTLRINSAELGSHRFYCRINCPIGPSVDTNTASLTISPVPIQTIAVISYGNGTVSPSSTQLWQQGSAHNITATPASGYYFVGWSLVHDCGTLANASSATTTFTVGSVNGEIHAAFAYSTPTPSPTPTPLVTPTPSPTPITPRGGNDWVQWALVLVTLIGAISGFSALFIFFDRRKVREKSEKRKDYWLNEINATKSKCLEGKVPIKAGLDGYKKYDGKINADNVLLKCADLTKIVKDELAKNTQSLKEEQNRTSSD